MKNGSVQRASKRSYMDEATLASVLKAVGDLRSEIARVEQAASAGCTELVGALTKVKREIDGKVGAFERNLAALSGRVEAIGTFVQSVAEFQVEAASESATTEPTCDHGFIGACAECDGSGQTPENNEA